MQQHQFKADPENAGLCECGHIRIASCHHISYGFDHIEIRCGRCGRVMRDSTTECPCDIAIRVEEERRRGGGPMGMMERRG